MKSCDTSGLGKTLFVNGSVCALQERGFSRGLSMEDKLLKYSLTVQNLFYSLN